MGPSFIRWVAAAVLVAAAPFARAGEKNGSAIPHKELEARVLKSLGETINLGAAAYNRGEQEACYRLYQGALINVMPLLEHRAALQAAVKKKMQQAMATRGVSDRAFALREVIDEVRAALHKDLRAARPLWDRLGGEKAVRAVVHDFVLAAAKDPKVDFTRGGAFPLDEKGVAMLEQRLVELISAVSGGPLKYSGRDMKAAHKGMNITDAEFNALAGHLVAVLRSYRVPQPEIDELVGIVASTRKDIVGQ
jgi:hemoglobin